MLKAIGFVIKLGILSALILVLGNWLSWDGKTLSDHAKQAMTQAQKSGAMATARQWTRRVTDDARSGAEKKIKSHLPGHARNQPTQAADYAQTQAESAMGDSNSSDQAETHLSAPLRPGPALAARVPEKNANQERIPPSERQKLRALIRELNSSHGRD